MRKRKSAAKYVFLIVGLIVFFLLAALLVCYFLTASYYAKHFFPGTVLNGVSVGKMTVEEAEKKVAQEVADYIFVIETRDGEKYQITGRDIDYEYVPGTEIRDILASQENYQWLTKRNGKNEVGLEVAATFDEQKLAAQIESLKCFQADSVARPKNAYIRENADGYEIVPAEEGNQLKLSRVIKLAQEAVSAGEEKLVLTDQEYKKPEVTTSDAKLNEALDHINSYLNTTIKYDVGDNGEVLDKNRIKDWITVHDDYSVTFDESQVTNYVQYLASKYNTYGSKRKFKTSLGSTVEIGGGDYGWVIDKEKEKSQILSEIQSGKTVEREPAFTQTAAVKSTVNDVGNTYVEIDYTNQHMYYYENGQLMLESDVVTGNVSQKNGSPDGLYKIVYKERDATLIGENYQSDVNYFMVFAYNVGFHDASWRNEFGGEIYKNSGSHGCVNMPGDKAKKLYEMLQTNTPVVAYYREPVELTAENAKISNAYSYVDESAQGHGSEEPKTPEGQQGVQPEGQPEGQQGVQPEGQQEGQPEGQQQ